MYGEYTRDRVGLFFGLTGVQLGILVAAGVPALWALQRRRWGLLAGVGARLGGGAGPGRRSRSGAARRPAGCWPRLAYAVGAVLRWTRWRSRAATGRRTDLDEPDLPGVLAGIRVHDGPPQGPTNTRVAIIQDHASRVWAVTAAISHPGLALADAAERDSQGRGLAALLNACARTELISEVLFLVRSVPDDGAEREPVAGPPPARRRARVGAPGERSSWPPC